MLNYKKQIINTLKNKYNYNVKHYNIDLVISGGGCSGYYFAGTCHILKNLEKTKLKVLIPLSIISFLFFTIWLVFNLILFFGYTIQCLPVYKIFLSGCSIL